MFIVKYSPQSIEDLKAIQKYILNEFGVEVAKNKIKKIVKDIQGLEMFPTQGLMLSSIVEVSTDYYYLFSNKNYIFYRIEEKHIKVLRVINEKQDYMRILFEK